MSRVFGPGTTIREVAEYIRGNVRGARCDRQATLAKGLALAARRARVIAARWRGC